LDSLAGYPRHYLRLLIGFSIALKDVVTQIRTSLRMPNRRGHQAASRPRHSARDAIRRVARLTERQSQTCQTHQTEPLPPQLAWSDADEGQAQKLHASGLGDVSSACKESEKPETARRVANSQKAVSWGFCAIRTPSHANSLNWSKKILIGDLASACGH
jgi:hypothetical protein